MHPPGGNSVLSLVLRLRLFALLSLPVELDLVRLGSIIRERLAEPRVLERLLGSNALRRIIDEYLPEQVEE